RRLPPRAVRPRPPVALNPVNIPVPEVTLQNQDGKAVRLYPDLMKDKLVVLGFFYTSCPYVCELQGRAFGKLRASLGKRLGKDVFLILATRDPDTDTPRRLKEWGARHGVRTGWTLLTGSARELSKLLKPFTNDPVGAVEAHTSTIFISGGKKGVWYTASGLSPTETLVEMIDSATRAEVSPK
ncbi:MAG TPA: SCO family protein, partial [Pyrinomonadaceae bacterium]